MKIGVFTDLHLGIRQYGLEEREEDFYSQYLRAIDTFIENKVDIVICAGDIFDKARPTPKALNIFAKGLKKLFKNNINFYNIVGNHSMVQSKSFVTADDFLYSIQPDNSSYLLLDKDSFFENEEVFLCGLPYYHNFQLNEFIEEVNKLNERAKGKKCLKILVLHQAFSEYCGFSGEKLSINDIDISEFDLIICGHIHDTKITEINENTIYLQPGSLERSSVAEARDEENDGKGVFIFDTDNFSIELLSNGFIRLKSPRKFLIADMYISKKEEVLDIKNEILENVNDCLIEPILFLTVHDTSQSFDKLINLTKELKSDCLTVHFNYFDESEKDDFGISSIKEIPSPREALKIALNPLDEDEARLGVDLYDNLKNGNDVSKILEDFFEKRRNKERELESSFDYNYDELEEFEEFFKNL